MSGKFASSMFVSAAFRRRSTFSSLIRSMGTVIGFAQHDTDVVLRISQRRRRYSVDVRVDYTSDLPHDLSVLVQKYAREQPTSASLQTLLRTGRGELLHKTYKVDTRNLKNSAATEKVLIQVAGFLRRELPIRLAHRIQELDSVPLMRDMPSVKLVRDTYIDSFLELIQEPEITNQQREVDFADHLEKLYEKHSGVLVDMARGAFELRERVRSGDVEIPSGLKGRYRGQDGSVEFERIAELHGFLDRFYTSRIGIRVLAGQYLALRHTPMPDYIGMICSKTSPCECVQLAADDASHVCRIRHGDAPDVIISGRKDLTFPYMPSHLHYILLELLKNSMRATMEFYDAVGADDYPPVHVIIADGRDNEDVVIKVSDEGGGIPRSNMKKIWSYLFTTADSSIQEGMVAFAGLDHGTDSPLAGLGYGLPISRAYARYFGGDLDVMSMEGYGTDAFVYLTRLGNSREPLGI